MLERVYLHDTVHYFSHILLHGKRAWKSVLWWTVKKLLDVALVSD